MWRAIYHEFRRRAKATEIASTTFRRTEITVETDRIWIIRKSQTTRGWCAECGREVDMVKLKEAGVVSGKNPQALTAQPMPPAAGIAGDGIGRKVPMDRCWSVWSRW